MTESTFLQIQGQGGDGSPIRVVELPSGPARVGSGPACEVRLGGQGLGDVQGLLRRRGSTWYYEPVGPPGRQAARLDDRRPLAFGIPFRVGDHWLTLRSPENATNDWGTFDSPIAVEPKPADPAENPRPDPSPSPSPSASTSEADDRVGRWQARLEQRERWLHDRQDERRWEARWKAAGESIRARSAQPTPPSPAPAPSPTRRTSPPPPPSASTPPRSRAVEPRPAEPLRRAPEPPRRPPTARVPLRPVFRPRDDRPTPTPPTTPKPAPPTTRALAALPAPVADVEVRSSVPADRPQPPSEVVAKADVVAISRDRPESAEAEPIARVPKPEPVAPETGPNRSEALPGATEAAPIGDPGESPPSLESALDPTWGELPPFVTNTYHSTPDLAWVAPFGWSGGPEAPSPGPARPSIEAQPAAPEEAGTRAGGPSTAADWPSARAIFEAQSRRAGGSRGAESAPAAGRRRRAKGAEPEPSAVVAPRCWTVPLWLGWLPTAAAVVAIGSGGLSLAWTWAVDGRSADFAARVALRPQGAKAAPIDPASIVRGPWWVSTAPHLAAWAVAVERSGDGEDRSEEVRGLLDEAHSASHLAAQGRFFVEMPPGVELGAAPELAHLGRTRDAATLAWTGRRLRRDGKADSAIRAFRAAFAIAQAADRDDLDPPMFVEDARVRRFELPHDAILAGVALAMVEAGSWTAEQWDEALPPSPLAQMAAARALRATDRPGSDRLLEKAIALADSETMDAESLASAGEAQAVRGRWAEAMTSYQKAIDRADDDPTRRAWWLNLADLSRRSGDTEGRIRAIEAAKSNDPGDRVTRRALQAEQDMAGVGSGRP